MAHHSTTVYYFHALGVGLLVGFAFSQHPTAFQQIAQRADRAHVMDWLTLAVLFASFVAFALQVRRLRQQTAVTEAATRAYLVVNAFSAVYQDAGKRFAGQVKLTNKGTTPAYDTRIVSHAEIVAFPIPDDFAFPLTPSTENLSSRSVIGPSLDKTAWRSVSHRVPDDQVDIIKKGTDRKLLIWGRLDYRDTFGKPHWTTFAFTYQWMPMKAGTVDENGHPMSERLDSYDANRYNDSD